MHDKNHFHKHGMEHEMVLLPFSTFHHFISPSFSILESVGRHERGPVSEHRGAKFGQ
jgi:hypothetical protein